jgi:hypothetical protein
MTFQQFAKYSVILSIIPALYFALFPGKIVLVTILCSYPLIVASLLFYQKRNDINVDGKKYINLFFAYNIIILLRGFIDANSYQDWTTLVSSVVSITLFLPFTIYFGAFNTSLAVIIRTFLNYTLILFFILLLQPDDSGPLGFTHIFSPIVLIILFLPFLKKKHALLIIILAIFSFFSDITIRSNLLNISIAFLIVSTFLWRKKSWILSAIKFLRALILLSPILLFILGVTGIFNIFSIGQAFSEIVIKDEKGRSQDVFVDSRTAIYIDVISQLVNDKAIIFGLGGSGKTKTSLTDIANADFDVVYREGRRGTESGMLNYIQWGGIIGGFIYFLLFVKASYLGIYKSNNWLCIMTGLWVAYKGLFSFIEDTQIFSLGTLFLLVPLGMCFNNELRKMNDGEITTFFRVNLFKTKVKSNNNEALV